MALNEELNQRIRNIFGKHPEITEKTMFGGVCFMHNGNMICGSDMSGLMLRVGPEQYESVLEMEYASEMDFTGKPMKGFVSVDPDGYETQAELADWLELALAFTDTLPPKTAKPKKVSKKKKP
jgi:TfoX/Sxy family transcriptional regulator of competence genes